MFWVLCTANMSWTVNQEKLHQYYLQSFSINFSVNRHIWVEFVSWEKQIVYWDLRSFRLAPTHLAILWTQFLDYNWLYKLMSMGPRYPNPSWFSYHRPAPSHRQDTGRKHDALKCKGSRSGQFLTHCISTFWSDLFPYRQNQCHLNLLVVSNFRHSWINVLLGV